MRRHYEQLGNDIAKYERESAALEHQQKITEELKQKVSQSAQECDSLRKQLEAEGTKIETLETKAERLNKCNKVLCDKLSTARNYAQRSKEEVEKERLRHEDEEEKRIAAEKRLEEFLDAQKKMNELIMGFRK
jgi:chromosome segregation ATPase